MPTRILCKNIFLRMHHIPKFYSNDERASYETVLHEILSVKCIQTLTKKNNSQHRVNVPFKTKKIIIQLFRHKSILNLIEN